MIMLRIPLEFVRRQWIARPLSVVAVCFLLGILLQDTYALPFALLFGLSVFCFMGYIALRKKKCAFALLLCLFFLFGSIRFQAAQWLSPDVPEQFSVNFEGKVVSDPIYNSETERIICVFQLETLSDEPIDHRVRLYLRSDVLPLEGIAYGQKLACYGHIWPQDHATNPYQFDVQNWLLSDEMTGMASAKLEDVEILSCTRDFQSWMIERRRAISDIIDRIFPQNAALAHALILGDRSGLNTELREQFSKTGITHLICISGMHVSVLAGAILWLLRKFMHRNHATIVTVGMIVLYGMLIGFPASLVRATVMFGVLSFAPLFGRYSDSPTRLSVALLGMLAFNPFYIYDGGFVLSFSATAGILFLEPPISALLRVEKLKHTKPHPNKWVNLLRSAVYYFPKLLCATLVAQLATLPIVISYFGGQSLLSLPVNLLAIPLTMFTYPLLLVMTGLSFFSLHLGCLCAIPCEKMLSLLTELAAFCGKLSLGQFHSPVYPTWLFFLHWLILLGASDLCKIPLRIRQFLPTLLPLFTGVSILCSMISTLGCRIIFLDAGQADAAVVKAERNVYIFDAGEEYSPITDYVTATCTSVDAVFLSHPHYDHVVGLTELLPIMQPDVIYVPEGWFDVEFSKTVSECVELAQSLEIPFVELSAGDIVALSEHVTVEVYSPNGSVSDANDLSLVLDFRYRDTGVLFTGDITVVGEPDIFPDVRVLKVPHHGSPKSTSDLMLSATSPEVSIVSVGENHYGHPSDEVLQKIADSGSEIYRTDQCGAITLRIRSNGKIQIDTYLSMEESK